MLGDNIQNFKCIFVFGQLYRIMLVDATRNGTRSVNLNTARRFRVFHGSNTLWEGEMLKAVGIG